MGEVEGEGVREREGKEGVEDRGREGEVEGEGVGEREGEVFTWVMKVG